MKTPIKVSIRVQRLELFLEGQSLMTLLSLYRPIILWEFNYFIILRFKNFRIVLYLWSPKHFQLSFINRLSKISLDI